MKPATPRYRNRHGEQRTTLPHPPHHRGRHRRGCGVWLRILAFGSDDAPTTTSAPATTATPATTIAPTTTDVPTTTSAPTTTTPEADDESLTVGVSAGAQECYGLASAEVEETSEQVNVTMTARSEATGCGDVGPH